jgi:phosphoribosylglycinamide formyltransferase-1
MNIAFLASHRGSNMQSIIDACKTGKLAARPVMVISNNADSGALARAAEEGIPACHLSSQVISDEDGIINIHPCLLPKYGGQGMYGMRVHEAVIASGDTESGVTIHVVNEEYDKGAILAQQKVPVEKHDSAKTLAERVLAVEHSLYPETICKIVAGEIALPDTA